MNIEISTSIALNGDEETAINLLMEAFHQCECVESFSCDDCPLHVKGHCVGALCEIIQRRNYKKG